MSSRCPGSVNAVSLSSPGSALDQAVVQAISHHLAGQTAEAERLYRSLMASPPGHPAASYGFGLLCATQGRIAEAIGAYRHAITARPDFVDAYINLGTVTLTLGHRDEAAALYRQAIAISPRNATAHGNLGKALQDLGRIDEAIAAYRVGIELEPDDATIHANLGSALLEKRDWDESETVTRRAIALEQNNPIAFANLGTALMNLDRRDEALAACRQAVALQPPGVAIHASIGGAMLELGALSEAVVICRHAISIDPRQPSAHFNLSHALKSMNCLDEAAISARGAIALLPDSAEYHFHLAHILLLQGNLEEGWAEYDWRWMLADFAWISNVHGPFAQPLWAGEPLTDKTILIYTEQGLGDVILFARYLPLVSQMAGRVIMAAHPPMRRLLTTIKGITVVSVQDVPLPHFDVHCPLLSLPRIFATNLLNIPATVPYLHVNPTERKHWDKRFSGKALKVGMVWAGNPATRRDHLRSPGLTSVAPLFSVPGVDFIVLQFGAGRNDLDARPLPANVLDLGEEIEDLADTAAIMSCLDLMISSCTAPLHLAGALGVRTWAMIPFAPYFPWLLERGDTPWYPNMCLYRQDQPGQDWSGVVERIAIDLAALVHSGQCGFSRSPDEDRSSVPVKDLCQDAPPDSVAVREIPDGPAASKSSHEISIPEADGFNELAACRDGIMLYNRNDIYIGSSLRKYGEFSGEEAAVFRTIVQPGMSVLDIGANIGVHTIVLSHLVGAAGAVHAFEPQRLMFQLLCANIALNSCPNVFTHQAAVGAAANVLLVPSLDPGRRNNYGGLSLLDSRRGESVPLVTIDGLSLRVCHFIKLDIEGMETEALRGATETIGQFRPTMYVENDRPNRSAELIALLLEYGYRLYWHIPRLYSVNNFRADTENIFGDLVSVNMICVPIEMPQSSWCDFREVTGPADQWYQQ